MEVLEPWHVCAVKFCRIRIITMLKPFGFMLEMLLDEENLISCAWIFGNYF